LLDSLLQEGHAADEADSDPCSLVEEQALISVAVADWSE